MGSKSKRYCWKIPQGYVGIKFTPYCIRVTYLGEFLYFDRNLGQTVSEEEIIKNMPNLDEPTHQALQQFLERYPTVEDKILYWCRGIQRTARTHLKRYAKELERMLKSQSLKKVNVHNNNKKKEGGESCMITVNT
jgi:hypothetical protein